MSKIGISACVHARARVKRDGMFRREYRARSCSILGAQLVSYQYAIYLCIYTSVFSQGKACSFVGNCISFGLMLMMIIIIFGALFLSIEANKKWK